MMSGRFLSRSTTRPFILPYSYPKNCVSARCTTPRLTCGTSSRINCS